jgi:DNA-3-methyladenine glycosylase
MTVKLRSCTNPGPLEAAFFNRPADTVARALVGKTLVCRVSGGEQALMVVETEAYLGPHDLACHAARGRTPRTDVMFGPPGMLYIYLVYGLHWMLNVVTGPCGYPAAVLLRSAGEMDGPGRLTAALGVDHDLNGKPAELQTGLWFEDRGAAPGRVIATRRIGVTYAGPTWSRRRLRFVLTPSHNRPVRMGEGINPGCGRTRSACP